MKFIHLILASIVLVFSSYAPCSSQTANVHVKLQFPEPFSLLITTNKTTSLVFPFAIKSVDRGSADLLVQEVKGIDNILQLKAAKSAFAETNLTVITADGSLYSYMVNYDPKPSRLTFSFVADTLAERVHPDNKTADLEDGNTETSVVGSAEKLLTSRERLIYGVKDKQFNMKLSLEGIYIRQDVMFYKLRLQNTSSIDYDVDMLRFYLRDKRQSKRTATQELEITPLYVTGNHTRINGKTGAECVVALPKFTVPDARYLAVELKEKNGGRNLLLKVHNRKIIHARVIRTQ